MSFSNDFFSLKTNDFLSHLQMRLFVFHVGSEQGKEFEKEWYPSFLVTDVIKWYVEMNHFLEVHFEDSSYLRPYLHSRGMVSEDA